MADSIDDQQHYYDTSGELRPAFAVVESGERGGAVEVSVFGDSLVAAATEGETQVNVEVQGGQLHLYAFDGDEPLLDVELSHEASRRLVRALLHSLLGNTEAAVRVSEAHPIPGLSPGATR